MERVSSGNPHPYQPPTSTEDFPDPGTPQYPPPDEHFATQPQQEADIADGARQPAPHESASLQEQQAIEWIVPVQNGIPPERRRTVDDRLDPTEVEAEKVLLEYAARAKTYGRVVNIAQFSQIVINALVTGLSAAPSNRKAQLGVAALGAIGTIIASLLVRIRGAQEPERSKTHSQNVEKFLRELKAFKLDHGLSTDSKWDKKIHKFRTEFDDMQTAIHQAENGQPVTQRGEKSV